MIIFTIWTLDDASCDLVGLVPSWYPCCQFTEAGDGWSFVCQHGPRECEGNTVQACVLSQVSDPLELVPLINCIMGADFPPDSADICLEMLDITTTSPERVKECVDSTEGSNLLHEIGVETKNLDPSLTGVPWILFNDVR